MLWNNLRDTRQTAIAAMYKTLRSGNTFNFNAIETRFENAQHKWPEAIWNEDAKVKYFDPLTNPDPGKEPTDFYLPMCQGSKEQQRKQWLERRFAYMDSKWNAGDALVQVIQLRGYAKSDITVTPYIDLYPSVKYGSYLVQTRGVANTAYTLTCPLDNVNDTEIYIYSAKWVKSVGDLSGLKVGIADFSFATNIQEVKVGDSSQSYDNPNLKSLSFGGNTLLKKIDARNCSGLGTDEQKNIDVSGCTILEEAYFDGTAIQGLTLPNGGVVKKVHLPSTITNLTILNQKNITELVVGSYANITTLRIENSNVNTKSMLNSIVVTSQQIPRVRLIGFAWECEDATEISGLLDKLDTMRGLDESGNNVESAQVSGTIHTSALTGAQVAAFNARYPYVTVTADSIASYLTYKTYDGETTIKTVTCLNGVPQENAPSVPSRANSSDGHYSYTGIGWNTAQDSQTADPSAITDVIADRTVYAAYTWVVRTYTVLWKNADNTTLETDSNVPWGTTPTYDGTTPTYDGETSTGWNPVPAPITGDTTYTATYLPTYMATFVRDSSDGGGTLYSHKFAEGTTPVYSGNTPTTTKGDSTDFTFVGWTPALAPIYAATTYTAVFRDNRAATVQYLKKTMSTYESQTNTKFGQYGLAYQSSLTSAKAPATTVEQYAFYQCTNLSVVDLSATSGAVTINANAFNGLSKLEHVIIRSSTMATLSATSAFTGTKIATGDGAIYVPTELVATYKANANWANYFIAPISSYPLSEFSSITDSWATIIANNNYATDYKIGDTKLLDIGTFGKYYMELVAMDEDNKADNSGKARMTWIMKDLMNDTHNMNSTSTTAGGWESSAMRTWLRETVMPQIQSDVRTAIVPVTKVSSTYENSALVKDGQTTTDTVWIPGAREIFNNTNCETTGAVYSTKFNSQNARVKKRSGSLDNWWLRSASNANCFRCVNGYGSEDYNYANNSSGVAIGFCI